MNVNIVSFAFDKAFNTHTCHAAFNKLDYTYNGKNNNIDADKMSYKKKTSNRTKALTN